jgi:hypothetical protein
MSFISLDIGNLTRTREKLRKILREQDKRIDGVKKKVEVSQAEALQSRKLFVVDSGFNTAYDTSFVVFKAAVVNEDMGIQTLCDDIYFFHGDNYQTERLRRLLMQQILYETLAKTVATDVADGSLVLVDGTITLTVFHPTLKDNEEYREHFRNFIEKGYTPLVENCQKRDIILLGFLKRTGSTYLAGKLGLKGLYDIYILNSLLLGNGMHIQPISLPDTSTRHAPPRHAYVTFYLNLKGWNYRFELFKQQANHYLVCIKNLLYWATETYFGMNPVFSKADESARVTKREANLKFNYITHALSEDEQAMLRLKARWRTHFGYRTRRPLGGLGTG